MLNSVLETKTVLWILFVDEIFYKDQNIQLFFFFFTSIKNKICYIYMDQNFI